MKKPRAAKPPSGPPKPGFPVSVKDLARAAGTSVGTVSMALNDNPVVAARTRERIRALAEKMGYRRNPAFAAIGSRSRWAKAVEEGTPVALVHEERPDGQPYPAQANLLSGMREAGSRLGYRVEDFSLAHGGDWAAVLRVLHARGFAGIVVGQMMSLEALELPVWSKFAALALGQQTQPLPMHTVRFSHHMSTRDAVLKIWARGYRRIGFLEGMHDAFTATEDFARHAGFIAGMRELGVGLADLIPPLEHPIRRVPEKAFRAWVRKHRPDAILSVNGWQTLGILQKWRYEIPGDFAFAALLGGDDTHVAHPVLSFDLMGATAIRQIDHLLRHGDYGLRGDPLQIIVPGAWKDGNLLPSKSP